MAPRHVPRGSRMNEPFARPRRSRLDLEDNGGSMAFEVANYNAGPIPKTVAAARSLKMIQKTGWTGFGVPVGTAGNVVYPLSENEVMLLNSMGTPAEDGVAGMGFEDGFGEIIGPWIVLMMLA